jgi:5'(3')-deoxyribonucleotidase
VSKNPVCLIDLDGTLADFDGAMRRALQELAGPGEDPGHDNWDVPHIKARRRLIKQRPGFWRELGVLVHGMDLLQIALELGCDVHVLTKGPSAGRAWMEKVEWCKHHLTSDVKITVTQEKSLVYGRILIDDWPAYFEPWLEVRPRGLVVCPAQPWNTRFSPDGDDTTRCHPRVFRYTDTWQRDAVKARMQAAINGELG